MKKNGIVLIVIGISCILMPSVVTGNLSLFGISDSYLDSLYITDYIVRAISNLVGLCFIAAAFDYKEK